MNSPTPRHARKSPGHAIASLLRILAIALAVLLVSGASITAIALGTLRNNIDTVALEGEDEEDLPEVPALGAYEGSFNLLIVGSDECVEAGGCPDRTEKLNDVTMLLHVAADHQTAVAISFPRDTLVRIPSCPREDGSGNYPALSRQQINVSLTYGGLPCTVKTVSELTGLAIPYAGILTFNGVKEISTAIGGVDVCVDGPIEDTDSGLFLPAAGTYSLEGAQALAFLRTRHGVGDGSDLGRISSQQVFLSSMVRKIKDDETLTDIPKLFRLATAATNNMELSNSLASINTMVSMALVLKDVPLEKITFVQYPVVDVVGTGRVQPNVAAAEELMAKIQADEPFLAAETGGGSTVDPNAPVAPSASASPSDPAASPEPSGTDDPGSASGGATPSPSGPEVIEGVVGQTAADYTCSVANN